jgi:hypothetical protein
LSANTYLHLRSHIGDEFIKIERGFAFNDEGEVHGGYGFFPLVQAEAGKFYVWHLEPLSFMGCEVIEGLTTRQVPCSAGLKL